jgi:chemotaxis protein MotB
MLRIVRNLSLVAVLGLSAALLGCNDPNKDAARDDQSARTLKDRIAQLENELAQAEARHNADQNQIDALRKELERLRATQTPAAPEGWTGVPGGAMVAIEGTLLFDSGKADIKPNAKKILAMIATSIKQQFPDREIYVFGHTDADPIKVSKWKDNYELSCQRSLSVVRFLQNEGIANYTAACGWGEHRPASDNADKNSKQANRRVEIYALNPR